jgi:hypothetical protein
MNTRIMTALLASAAMLTGFSALAQTAAPDDSSMTCQQMMDKAKPMVSQMSDQKKMAQAQKEMTKAQTDSDAGKMKTCKMRMKKVMKLAQ